VREGGREGGREGRQAHCLCLDSCRVFTSLVHPEERKGGRGRGEEGRKAAACDWGTERHTCKYKHAQAHALHHFLLLPLPPFLDGRTNLPSPKKEGMWEWVGVSATTEPFISLPLFYSHLVSTIHGPQETNALSFPSSFTHLERRLLPSRSPPPPRRERLRWSWSSSSFSPEVEEEGASAAAAAAAL